MELRSQSIQRQDRSTAIRVLIFISYFLSKELIEKRFFYISISLSVNKYFMKVSSTFFQIVLIFLGNILLSKCQTNHLPVQMLRMFNRAFMFE